MDNKKNILITSILIFLGMMFYLFANFQRIAIPGAIFDLLGQELNVSAPYITTFGAIFMYVYAVTQLINGVLVDRFGGFRIMFTGGIILVLGALIFPLSSNIIVMYLSRGLVGIGSSMFYLSLIKELRNIVSEKDFKLPSSFWIALL